MRKGNARFGKRDMGYVQTLNSLVLGLFASGEPGFWLDPSDLSTMYQDAAGTTPVTAVEQPVGRINDKSGRGCNFTQSTAGVRPVLSARVNLLLATATLSTQSVTVAAGSYVLAFSGAGSIALSGVSSGTKTAGSNTITCTAGTLTLTVTGSVTLADLRPADQATGLIPLYQAVVTAANYDTAGFPLYLSGNGTQWMQCAAQDYTGVNKMLVCAGVRKIGTVTAFVNELSANSGANAGSFYIGTSVSGSNDGILSNGTSYQGTNASIGTAPYSKVLTGLMDIAAPYLTFRSNGAQVSTNTLSQGTGNYGNYPAYLFSRAGASLFLTGNIYQLIARGSTVASNAAQISAAESWTDLKTKAY